MNVRKIIKQYLIDNGYDGLCTIDCGCPVDDLAPCSDICIYDCEAGYKVPCDPETCPADGKCKFHIGTKRTKTMTGKWKPKYKVWCKCGWMGIRAFICKPCPKCGYYYPKKIKDKDNE